MPNFKFYFDEELPTDPVDTYRTFLVEGEEIRISKDCIVEEHDGMLLITEEEAEEKGLV